MKSNKSPNSSRTSSVTNANSNQRESNKKRNCFKQNRSKTLCFSKDFQPSSNVSGLQKIINSLIVRDAASIANIVEYIESSPKLLEMAKDLSEDFKTVILNLACGLKYAHCEKNKVVMRTGDEGDNFYILLDGQVDVLIAKEQYLNLTRGEYRLYMSKLYYYEEHELISRLEVTNSSLIRLDPEEIKFYSPLLELNEKKTHKALHSKTIKMTNLYSNEELNALTTHTHDSNTTSVEDYIKRITIEPKPTSEGDKLSVLTYQYFPIIKLEKGNFFGEVALKRAGVKRTASIISSSDCHFGYLTRTDFVNYMQELMNKQFNNEVTFFIKSEIFHGVYKANIKKKYFFLFAKFKKLKGDMLLNKNEPAEKIYFMKKGTIEFWMDISLDEIDSLIEQLGGKTKENQKRNLKNKYGQFEEFLKRKRKFKVLK